MSNDPKITPAAEAKLRSAPPAVAETAEPVAFDPIHSRSGDFDFAAIDDLVNRFSTALREKLRASEVKYGRNSSWMSDDWKAECQRHLVEHLAKGDPRDVAAYCAFLWHHGWPTIGPLTTNDVQHVAALATPSPAPSACCKGLAPDAESSLSSTEARRG